MASSRVLMALSGRCYDDFTTVARLHPVLMELPVRIWHSYGVSTAFMEFLTRPGRCYQACTTLLWRTCFSCATCYENWRFKVHTSMCLSSSSLYPLHIVPIIMAEDIQNLIILYQMLIMQYNYTMIIWKCSKSLSSILYSRRENVVETP